MTSSFSGAPSLLNLIREYKANRPDIALPSSSSSSSPDIQNLATLHLATNADADDEHSFRERLTWTAEFFRPTKRAPHDPAAAAYFAGKANREIVKMPVNPAEENVGGDITDQVAKDSKDSTASSHPMHDVETGAKGKISAAEAHKANPGPVIVNAKDIGEPASKEELKKRAEELNK